MTMRRIVFSRAMRCSTGAVEASHRRLLSTPSPSSSRFLARRCMATTSSLSSKSFFPAEFAARIEIAKREKKLVYPGSRDETTRTFATSRQKKAAAQNGEKPPDDPTLGTAKKVIPPPSSGSDLMQIQSLPDTRPIKRTGRSNKDNKMQYKTWEEFTMAHENSYLLGSHKDMFDKDIHLPSAPIDWTGYEKATSLWEDMAAQIGVSGQPISVAEYMRQCLTHPKYGYYTKGTSSPKEGKSKSLSEFDSLDEELLKGIENKMKDEEEDEELNKKLASDEGLVIGGDFVTAPEVSSIFGESLGIWMTITKQQQGLIRSGKRWQYVEAGPGKGTLLADLMRYWSVMAEGQVVGPDAVPAYVHLIEFSPKLKQIQKERLQGYDILSMYDLEFVDFGENSSPSKPTQDGVNIKIEGGQKRHKITVFWHDTLTSFKLWQHQHESYLPICCICQEFMDALPVYAFQKTAEGWRERFVDVALREDIQKEEEERAGIVAAVTQPEEKLRLRLVLAPELTPAAQILLRVNPETGLIPHEEATGQEAPIGSIVEINPEAVLMVQDLAKLIALQGGGALIIDYGQEGSRDTIRAFGGHQQFHFLSQPGNVDITADVDFSALKHAVNNMVNYDEIGLPENNKTPDKEDSSEEKPRAVAYGPVPQGVFLMSMGVKDRALQLAESATDEQQEDIYDALVMLCDPSEMGERFKVMAITKMVKRFGVVQTPSGF